MSAKKIETIKYECTCERCGNVWLTRGNQLPKVCPRCKQTAWNKPRKVKAASLSAIFGK